MHVALLSLAYRCVYRHGRVSSELFLVTGYWLLGSASCAMFWTLEEIVGLDWSDLVGTGQAAWPGQARPKVFYIWNKLNFTFLLKIWILKLKVKYGGQWRLWTNLNLLADGRVLTACFPVAPLAGSWEWQFPEFAEAAPLVAAGWLDLKTTMIVTPHGQILTEATQFLGGKLKWVCLSLAAMAFRSCLWRECGWGLKL